MTTCEAFEETREPNCENKAEYVFYQWKDKAGYPILLCQTHLEMIFEDYYDVLKEIEVPSTEVGGE